MDIYGNRNGVVMFISTMVLSIAVMPKCYDYSMEQIIIDDNGRYIMMKACF
jgi:hypothetical protein